MKMARARANHAAWRELIAARLDRPLTRSETRSLATHLRDCAACREADHDYREQRGLLRALSPRPVPRDLWPRTSSALDREVARGSYRFGRTWRRRGRAAAPSAALMTTIAALGVVAALGVMQVMPPVSIAPTNVPAATPFAIAPQPLAFVGSDQADMYVYQTDVNSACPANAPDCSVDEEDFVRTAVNLPPRVHARNAVLSPSGKAIALVGRDLNRDVIAVVLLPDGSNEPGTQAPDGSLEPGTSPNVPPESPGTTDDPQATPSGAPNIVAILENVKSAGAPPAWSPSGEMLAFSAMPADGSHGPDVYVWSPNEALALPVTNDHASYFASWSGEHIVISRAAAKGGSDVAPLSTVVMDPSTGEERAVRGPALWLPVVNPARTQAVAWLGDLDLATGLAVPTSGALYIIDWAAIDPYASGNEPVATPVASETPMATDAPPTDAPPTDAPTDSPTVTPASPSAPPATDASAVPASAAPSATPKPRSSDARATSDGSPSPQPTALPNDWIALDLGRDTGASPILDWQARWSLDGQVLGIWLADTIGSTWGRLAVMAVDPETDEVQVADPLLPATLARRGFSLGLSRVAWVAPSEDNADGELRIRTWGDDGVGGMRLQPFQLEEVLPAF
ncbi:MAG: hypothetical protein QOJ81_93 [Chloroflexota bacterium]|jgi:hypothetical protein|nr:hypothetical protein [Chloroflexota bacterium]